MPAATIDRWIRVKEILVCWLFCWSRQKQIEIAEASKKKTKEAIRWTFQERSHLKPSPRRGPPHPAPVLVRHEKQAEEGTKHGKKRPLANKRAEDDNAK